MPLVREIRARATLGVSGHRGRGRGFGREALAAVVGLVQLVAVRAARADDEVAACTTVTTRSADDIFQPTTDDANGPKGVSIEAGETLCIAGEENDSGILRPRLVDPRQHEAASLLVRLETKAAGETLHVATALQGQVRYLISWADERTGQTWPRFLDLASASGPDDRMLGAKARVLLNQIQHVAPSWMRQVPTRGRSPSHATTADDLRNCSTVSARDPSAIVVPITDHPHDPLGIRYGVTILPGETLCLAGPVGQNWFEPRLTHRDLGEPAFVRLRRDPRDEGDRLYVLSGESLTFDVATLQGPANFARPEGPFRVGPQESAWSGSVPHAERVLLYQFKVRRSPVPVAPAFSQRLAGAEFAVDAVLRMSAVNAFDRALRASGYGPLPRAFGGGKVGLDFVVLRWRLQADFDIAMGGSSGANGGRVSASFVGGVVAGGYDFLRWRNLTGFALAGIGVSKLFLDAEAPGWDALGASGPAPSGTSLADEATVASMQVGFQQAVAFFSWDKTVDTSIRLRAGYDRQIGRGGWSLVDSQGGSHGVAGPDVDLGGAWVTLGLDIGWFMDPPWRVVDVSPPDPHPSGDTMLWTR